MNIVSISSRRFTLGQLATLGGLKPTGRHWNSSIAVLRNNGLIETGSASAQTGGRRYREAALLREER